MKVIIFIALCFTFISDDLQFCRTTRITSVGSQYPLKMAIIDKLPQAFWTQASLNFKKFKKGALPLDECYDNQRKLYISQLEKLEKEESSIEAQKKIKMDKAKKIEKVMERLQRQSLLNQKQKPVQDTEVKQSVGSVEKDKVKGSTSDPEMKMEVEEAAKTETRNEDTTAPRLYNCDECEAAGEKFDSNLLNVFESHIFTNHPLYKPFKCKQCEYTSHKRQNLQKHLRSVHK